MMEKLNNAYRAGDDGRVVPASPEELLFCDHVRAKFGYDLVSDDVILRPVMQARKASKSGRRSKVRRVASTNF
jgi:hypothetical protein